MCPPVVGITNLLNMSGTALVSSKRIRRFCRTGPRSPGKMDDIQRRKWTMTGMVGRFGRIFLRYGCKTLLLLLAVSVIAFALVSLSPVDPVQQYVLGAGGISAEQRAQLEEYWGVNDPPAERYITWLKALVRGDFGQSLLYRRPVLEIIGERFVNSQRLAVLRPYWLWSRLRHGHDPGPAARPDSEKTLLHP